MILGNSELPDCLMSIFYFFKIKVLLHYY